MNITIMTTIMSMITNIIMNMTRTAPADATITKNMSMITATTMKTITIMKTTTTTMSTIMNMTKTAPADAMTIITDMSITRITQKQQNIIMIRCRRKRCMRRKKLDMRSITIIITNIADWEIFSRSLTGVI